MNYFSYWQIKKPIFLSQNDEYVSFSQDLKQLDELIRQNLHPKGQVVLVNGTQGSGKTTLLKHLYQSSLDENKTCLYSLSTQNNFYELCKKISKNFITTSDNKPTAEQLSDLLEVLHCEKIEVVLFVDGIQEKNLQNFLQGIKLLKEIADHQQNNLSIVLSFDLESLPNSLQGLLKETFFHQIYKIPIPSLTDFKNYITQKLLLARIATNPFSEDSLETIYNICLGDLLAVNHIAEHCLQYCFLIQEKVVSKESLKTVLKNLEIAILDD